MDAQVQYGAVRLLKETSHCTHDWKINLIMAWYESSISRPGLLESTRGKFFLKAISGVHTDPYEESSGMFHVL